MTGYERYAKIRDEKGLKDKNVADAIGITRSTFSDWKSGRCAPKFDKIAKIANFLEVSIAELTGKAFVTIEYGGDRKIKKVQLERPRKRNGLTLKVSKTKHPFYHVDDGAQKLVATARIIQPDLEELTKKYKQLSKENKEKTLEYIEFLLQKEKKNDN